tara:strand:- start:8090 stop:8626 length:537 start_codon:yes stop_codon:yes gene_type:complete
VSRIGKNPIIIPDNVKIQLENNLINISGPKGVHTWSIHEKIKAELKDNTIIIDRFDDTSLSRSLHGTTRQIVNNMVIGVSDGFEKELEIVGVGYQASIEGNRLRLQIGFSHDIYFDFPDAISITADRTIIKINGIDKQLVGSVASKIRSFRKPEPYKGKGIRYKNEYVKIKQGKTVGE